MKNLRLAAAKLQLPAFVKRRWKLVIVVLVALLLGGSWLLQSRTPEEEQLVFEQPRRQTLTKTLDVSGVVDAKEKAQLRFLTGGKIVYVGAQIGDWVQHHQTIARVDARTQVKQQDKILNNYLIERWNWESTLDDTKDEDLTDNERRAVEQEQFRLNNSVLDVEIQQIAISESYLSAPFAGILTVAPTTVAGAQLAPTDYFEIVNPSSLIFRAAVDETDIAAIAPGQTAKIELDAYRGTEFESEVSYVSFTSSSTTTGTVFLIELPFDSPDINQLRIGMNGDVRIELAKKDNALTIPLNATRERDNKVFVDVRTGENQYEEREIVLGLETDELVEVVGGLTEDDWVLIPD